VIQDSTFPLIVPASAYPLARPSAFASQAILPVRAYGLDACWNVSTTVPEPLTGFFVPMIRFALLSVHSIRRVLWGWLSVGDAPADPSPYPFGPSLSTHLACYP